MFDRVRDPATLKLYDGLSSDSQGMFTKFYSGLIKYVDKLAVSDLEVRI